MLRASAEGRFELVVSPHLLYELQAVLSRDKFRRYLMMVQVGEYLLWLRSQSTVVEHVPEGASAGATPDPDDDYLVALAVASGASHLVSGDGHLLDAQTGATGAISTPILTPREFLEQLEREG